MLLTLLILNGCSATLPASHSSPNESSRWFITTTEPPKGVLLLVHGLNVRPSAMNPLATTLASEGYHVYRITLHGHNGRTSEIFDENVWVRELSLAYQDIRARFPNVPSYLMGYSLGGLALVTMLDSTPPDQYPQAMVLLAPSISLRGALDVATTLHVPPPITWAVTNLTPRSYQRYEETPLFWYSNTLALYRNAASLKNIEHLRSIPTLVFLNEADELVSAAGTSRWIKEHNLESSWRIEMVDTKRAETKLKEHLIIDQRSLGQKEWSRLNAAIENFLARH
jgi:alpha-beta hydrolase superfamily lysophospholipase